MTFDSDIHPCDLTEFTQDAQELAYANRYTGLRQNCGEADPPLFSVFLKVDHQFFELAMPCEEHDARWRCWMLAKAMKRAGARL